MLLHPDRRVQARGQCRRKLRRRVLLCHPLSQIQRELLEGSMADDHKGPGEAGHRLHTRFGGGKHGREDDPQDLRPSLDPESARPDQATLA